MAALAGCAAAPAPEQAGLAPVSEQAATAAAAPQARPAPAPAPATTPLLAPAAATAGGARPTRLLIPSIQVDSGFVDLGLKPDGTLEVPQDGSIAGWYTQSPRPGELGPAVLAAHVDWKGKRGVFYDLRQVRPGESVRVERVDGVTVEFAVRRVEQYPKNRFPTTEVYGNVDSSQLRLITCGGDFDRGAHSYRDNIVVYAELVGVVGA